MQPALLMKIYLDVCCLNRPFDDQTQDRIHLESEAVITILRHIESGDWIGISRSVVLFEINQTPNADRKQRLLKLSEWFSLFVKLDEEIYFRAETIKQMGFKSYDALHLACAQKAKVDIFLSTDDKLIKIAIQNQEQLNLKVDNPLKWLQEVLQDDNYSHNDTGSN